MTEKLETCRKAIEKFGIKAQVGMMHEEMCELGVALEHWKRDRCKKEDVVTEIADVMIVAPQMAIYFGKEAVDAEIDRKLERLEGRMKGESEDETIRKKMIEHFKSKKKETWCNTPIKSILAYLEKQKDRKPVITGDDVAWIDDLKHDLEHPEELDEKVQEALKKRQKPAEWSNEDSDMICEIIDHCITIPYIGGTLRLSDERKKELKTFVKSIRPQPNQEWSEEDKKELKYTVSVLERCGFSDSANWLKSLPNHFSLKRTNVTVDSKLTYDENGEPELTQFEGALFSAFSDAWQEYMRGETVNVAQWAKEHSEELLEVAKEDSVKWSEEDEKNLHHCLEIVGGWEVDYDNANPHYSTWLKSLRPQSKQELQFKKGDKVRIHCRKDRKKDITTIYDGKVGKVINIWDAKKNPWGHIDVRLDNGCNNGFYEDELEVLDEPRWKPSEEQMAVLEIACKYEGVFTQGQLSMLLDLKEQLKKL